MTTENISRVLFVCTGNSCRSIMAEAYMKKRLAEEQMAVEVMSAGTWGFFGTGPTKEVIQILANEGVDHSEYGSKGLTAEHVGWADLILVMEPAHKTRVLDIDPGSEGKVLYLGQFDPGRGDVIIPDPIGRSMAFYRESFRIIKSSIEELIKWIKK